MLNEVTFNAAGDTAEVVIAARKGDFLLLVDKEDLPFVQEINKIVLYTDPKGRLMARADKTDNQVLLHRHLFDIPRGHKLEWINGNTLDLRRENLQLVDGKGNITLLAQPKEEAQTPQKEAETLNGFTAAQTPQEGVEGWEVKEAFTAKPLDGVYGKTYDEKEGFSIQPNKEPVKNYEELEREHLGDIEKGTGIYDPPKKLEKGVVFHKHSQKWTCRPHHEGKRYSLGYFDTVEEAIAEILIFRAEGPESPKLKRNQRKGKN